MLEEDIFIPPKKLSLDEALELAAKIKDWDGSPLGRYHGCVHIHPAELMSDSFIVDVQQVPRMLGFLGRQYSFEVRYIPPGREQIYLINYKGTDTRVREVFERAERQYQERISQNREEVITLSREIIKLSKARESVPSVKP